jgi:L-lactate dehydrogenase complex protein LldG
VSAFHKIIANIRGALERPAAPPPAHDGARETAPLLSAAAHRVALAAQFGGELEAVGGHFFGLVSPAEARDRLAALVGDAGIRSVALGASVACDGEMLVQLLTRQHLELIRPARVKDEARAALRERIANCDLGVIEADYAIAATGTFCVIATPERPSSLTILPPINFIVVAADRVLPTLAEVIEAVGAHNFAAHRVALITGPSRTADIEKMIVIGVHGPKQLYAAVLA